MAPPREQSVAKPLIQPWRDIEILRVPLPTSKEAATTAPQLLRDSCPVCGSKQLHGACGPPMRIYACWKIW